MKILIGAGLLFTFLFVNNQSKTEVYYLLHEKNNLQDVGKEVTEYCQKNDFNEEFCVLIDMSIHSGKNRLFLWDMEKDSILTSTMSMSSSIMSLDWDELLVIGWLGQKSLMDLALR